MSIAGIEKRLLRDENGFTLSEVIVTMLILMITLFALYNIFDMSIRVFSFGSDKVEATENARVTLERMEREVRAAYPQSGGVLLNAWTTNQITFQNKVGSAAPVTISYSVDGGNNLVRQEGSTTAILAPLGTGGSFQLKYYARPTDSEIPAASSGNEPRVGMVQIKLRVVQDGREQRLETSVDLRNRGSS